MQKFITEKFQVHCLAHSSGCQEATENLEALNVMIRLVNDFKNLLNHFRIRI